MPAIQLKTFKGIVPKLAPKLLPEYAAQTARNCTLGAGRIEPLNGLTQDGTVAAGTLTLFRWRYTSALSSWLTWTSDVNVVQSPLAGDQYRRVYYTGDGAPKMKIWDTTQTPAVAVTRNLAMSVPGKPKVGKTDIFSVTGITMQERVVVSGIGSSTDTETINGRLTGYRKLSDGKLEMTFDFGEIDGLNIVSSLQQIINLRANFDYRLTFPTSGSGGGAVNLPAAMGTDIWAESPALYSSGAQYATVTVKSVSPVGRNVAWNNGDTISQTYANPEISPHQLVVTLEFDYEDSLNTETQYQHYVQTYVDKWGNESPRSPISSMVEWTPGTRIALSSLGSPTGDDVGIITKRRLYRSAAGSESDKFYFLVELPIATTTYADIIRDADLGEELPVFTNPIATLAGLVVMPGGFGAAFSGRDIYFSEPFLLQSWPVEYMMTVDDDVVALAVSGNDLIVLTKGNPYIISGSHPSTMTQARLMIPQACVAKRGVAYIGSGVAYPSPDGLVLIQGGQARLVTEGFYSRSDWQALTPTGAVSAVHDGRLIVSFPTAAKSVIFEFGEGLNTVTDTDIVATAMFSDLLSDTLYMVISTNRKTFDTDTANPRTLIWRGGELPSERNVNWSTARIVAAAYPVTFRLYAQNVEVFERVVTSEAAFRISPLRPERVWSVEVEGAVAVDEIHVGTSMEAIR